MILFKLLKVTLKEVKKMKGKHKLMNNNFDSSAGEGGFCRCQVVIQDFKKLDITKFEPRLEILRIEIL